MKRYFHICFLTAICCLSISSCTNKSIVFRCDDIRVNLDSQNIAMFELFEKYNIHFTCAIIPFDEKGDTVEYNRTNLEYLRSLQKRGIVEIALHGYSHTWTGDKGELDGLSYQEQFAKIQAGKSNLDYLFETDIVSFVPPRNYYDTSTIRVLEDLSFSNISADANIGCPIIPAYLNYIPFTCGELRLITEELRKSQWGG